ncbi:hypothetical protein HF888_11985 [Bermanella marisrubri]|uniref:Flagellar assembly protein FliH n=1 Tax=Bermanella marisrubri TaxID=207949 RepID=Q1N2X2_9GAMM|nr:FliH/SctL family protein [Bermanella marisrubri]EAT12547.1 flagellar assembly protein [Oceanobacter sp. RED65] [Bermanella marisrubri]QIZ84895.1 hypothetical protein HF888_11985 [Bermanella marisrubri]
MNQRRERIPAKDVKESKNWSLPYWTQNGDVIQKQDDSHENDPDVWVEDEEEMELEPLTAEALEAIRQEAYNDGLEQGLIEGRQKGEKQGYDEGFQEGKRQGLEEGKSQGYKDGLDQGNKEASQSLDKQEKAFKQASQHVYNNLDKAFQSFQTEIEETLPELIEMLATAVVGGELEQGSEHIVNLVKDAMEAIPVDKQQVTILVNEADLPFLEAGLDNDYQIVPDDRVDPGGCQLQSKYSAADYSLSKRMKQVLSDYRKQLQLGSQTLDDDEPNSILEGVDLEASEFQDQESTIETKTDAEMTTPDNNTSVEETETEPTDEQKRQEYELSSDHDIHGDLADQSDDSDGQSHE